MAVIKIPLFFLNKRTNNNSATIENAYLDLVSLYNKAKIKASGI